MPRVARLVRGLLGRDDGSDANVLRLAWVGPARVGPARGPLVRVGPARVEGRRGKERSPEGIDPRAEGLAVTSGRAAGAGLPAGGPWGTSWAVGRPSTNAKFLCRYDTPALVCAHTIKTWA